ncbi:SIR2 family NAD-dependent protein deacylase [Nitrosophilus kaiyonis]|uniref:SIR2 family NAD-dependent protein deacylase n=1 Tax=Nitrosophilus kaiyonis TaxID=2930200 RepID=UPI0024914A94|nr:Sir2 family NAD-dependent protein deacetylase [Nitrosophilus kaiyonis]
MIKKAAKLIKEAEYLLITAGAGMGVDSGLPDFRGKEGFWRAYPIAKKLNLSFEELANPRWFKEDPHLAWAFYGHRLNLYRDTKPHDGFYKLLEIAKSKKDYFVFTSNVDGQFQKAGFNENKIYEVHGSIHYLQCLLPCADNIWSAKNLKIEIDMKNFKALNPLPRCPKCGEIARPNILMFGDFSWISKREDIQREYFESFLNRAYNNLAIIEFGAGTAVPTVRITGEQISKNFNAPLIRVNPREPNGADIELAMGAKEAIEKIYELGFQ